MRVCNYFQEGLRRVEKSRVQGLGFRASGFDFPVSDFGFRVWGTGFQVSVLGFRVSGFGFRVSSFRFRVSGFGSQVSSFGFRIETEMQQPPREGASGTPSLLQSGPSRGPNRPGSQASRARSTAVDFEVSLHGAQKWTFCPFH